MQSSSSEKIYIQCGKSFKENSPLNHVGAQYHEDQNEKYHLKTILDQAHALQLNNLASNIAEIFKIHSTFSPTFIHLSCRDYLRNISRQSKRLLENVQQSSVKRVTKRSDPGLFDFKRQYFYCEKACIDDKKHFNRKTLKLLA